MKKGLMLAEGSYLNMGSIVEWWFDNDSIHISTVLTDGSPIIVTTDNSEYRMGASHRVPINEFHRIKREINNYMGCMK